LVSVEPKYQPSSDDLLAKILSVLGWQADDIDNHIPPARAYAGNWHFVLAAKTKARLDNLQYDFETLKKTDARR
jgi:predicted PhzF superfamily epimerase YddE/YHI9